MIRVRQARSRSSLARQGLVRDTLIILGGALAAILLAQLTTSHGPATATGSPTPPSSEEVVVGNSQAFLTLPPLSTIGEIVNPSTGFGATPTPVPFITLGPPTPTPSAGPGGSPGATIKPTPKPTVKPTPTAPPIVLASFTCTQVPGTTTVNFTDTSSGQPTSWSWTFGDLLNGTSTAQNPTYDYTVVGDFQVNLTATGAGGTDSAQKTCSVVLP